MLKHFHVNGVSGIVAGAVDAASALFAWENTSTSKFQYIERIRVRANTITGYPTEAERSFQVVPVSAFPASYTGGTDLVATIISLGIRTTGPGTEISAVNTSFASAGDIRIASTAALANAGSPTLATQPFIWNSNQELADEATVAAGRVLLEWEAPQVRQDEFSPAQGMWWIRPGEGFIVSNGIAIGVTGTFRLNVEIDFAED